MKSLFILLIAAISILAAPGSVYNNTEDTSLVASFNADSLKYGNVASLSSASGCNLIVGADDTTSAGFVSDSLKFYYGVQFGSVVVNSNVKRDTAWSPLLRVGTFSTLPADTANKWLNSGNQFVIDTTTGEFSYSADGVMDSSNVTGYIYLQHRFSVSYPCEFARPWVQGLSGNLTGELVKVRLQLKQLNYLPTRQQ